MFKLPFLKSKFFKPRFFMVVLFVLVIGFFFVGAANATGTIANAIATFLGWIIYGIVWALGQLLVLMMEILVYIAQWSLFISAPAVVLGWKIVRDICNMFFVVIMLVIAFATVLRVEKYSYQKLLPKLIIMAILINFSKMICGLIIDVSQVVMLTFVNSFKDVAGANLTTILGLDKITTVSANDANNVANATNTVGSNEVTGWSILGAYVLALIFVLISLITITVMVMMLAIRIVMLWIYVVLSPMAYLLAAFPDGQKYSGQWWSEFTKNVIVGPILAFFIWLSFAALGNPSSVPSSIGGTPIPTNQNIGATGGGGSQPLTTAGSPNNMLNFLISIAMLYGGLQVTQSIGGAAGGMAGKGISSINKGKGMVVAGALAAGVYAKRKGITAAKWTGRMGKTGLGGLDRMAGAKIDSIRKGRNNGVLDGTSMASRGLVGTSVGIATSFAGNKINKVKANWNKDDELNRSMRTYLANSDKDPLNAKLEHNGKKYVKSGDHFQEIDEANNLVAGSFLKNNAGNNVTEMSREKAAWQQSWRDTNGKAESESSKKQEKEISEKQQQLADSNLTVDEMLLKFSNASTSATEKMALAMTLAAKGAFKDKDQVKAAKAAVANNYVLGKKINDEIDKNQTHLNYDMTKAGDVEKFHARIDLGKIDVSNMRAESYKDDGMLKAIEGKFGLAETRKILEKASTRGVKVSSSIAEGAHNAISKDANGKIAADDIYANLQAGLSGKIENSFTITETINGVQQAPRIDHEALGRYLKNATGRELNKIQVPELQTIIANNINGAQVQNEILNSIKLSQLKTMKREGSNNAIVREIRDLHVAINPGAQVTAAIQADQEISNL
ncbi:MAG: hypothetical protein ACOYMB_03920 [Patescibacteria group bacterium]